MLAKIKELFARKKSSESLKMWESLGDNYLSVHESHHSLDLDAGYALTLSEKDRNAYLTDLMRRRQAAHYKYT